MRITDLPPLLRPRERLLSRGAATLSDAELVAILLRTGSGGQSAIDLAQCLLDRFGSLGTLLRAEPNELSGIRGVGNTKRATLLCVHALLRRALEEELQQSCLLDSPQAVRRYLRHHFAWMQSECFVGLFVDMKGQLIESVTLATGTLDRVSIYPREIVRLALKHNAAAVIFAHNHPGGHARPSELDKKLTARLKQAMDCVEVKMLDHLVIAGEQTWSFHEHGLC
ncbi:MAG: hypothetical protein RL404_119 [Pseudomonadota bacterium]|jgi:DNA repair protein RadC